MTALFTIDQALEDAAACSSNGFRFIEEGQRAEAFFSFVGIERATARFGGALQALGLKKGDRVALILPENQDFVFAFLGAIRAGIIPVPIYPPAGLRKLGGYLDSTLHIVVKSGAKVVVTDADIKRLLGTIQLKAPTLQQVVAVEQLRKEEHPLLPVGLSLDDTAFLQFTSGSTSAPKGVVLSHANIAHNVTRFLNGLGVEKGVTSGASWLPLYHDMGLIGFVLSALYFHNPVTFLPPLLFLKRPARWLETISRHKAHISFGPNFAYALCVKRVRDRDVEGLDLSCWKVAGCGAEPIRAANLHAFADKFEPIGFDRNALLACYGMAESTLAISFGALGGGVVTDSVDGEVLAAEGRAEPVAEDADTALGVVSCGKPFEGHEVAVFADDDARSERPLPERTVGELRVRGPSVTSGYFDDPALTAQAFAGGWLRTGDLGYLVDGDVYICGRQKELIIVNGRNYYPQDLEWEAGRVQGVRKGNVVAFGTRKPLNDRERVVIVFETSQGGDQHDAIKEAVRRAVRTASGLTIDDVVAVDAGVLPKTSSGKLKRNETRALYETGRLFHRTSSRGTDPLGTVKEIARSQLGYVRHALQRQGIGHPGGGGAPDRGDD